jgi:hypothetical protein
MGIENPCAFEDQTLFDVRVGGKSRENLVQNCGFPSFSVTWVHGTWTSHSSLRFV